MNGWRVGVSSIGLPLAEVTARGNDPADAALARWRDSRGLDFLLVMSSHSAGGTFQRELGTSVRGDAAVAMLPRLVRLPSVYDASAASHPYALRSLRCRRHSLRCSRCSCCRPAGRRRARRLCSVTSRRRARWCSRCSCSSSRRMQSERSVQKRPSCPAQA